MEEKNRELKKRDLMTAPIIEANKFEELVTAVIRQLPRDIDSATAQGWIDNQTELQRALRKALMPTVKAAAVPSNIFPVIVDYGKTVEAMIKADNYHLANPNITSKNFHTKKSGIQEVVIELIHFNRVISTDEAVKGLYQTGCRPADLYELLAFGKKYPDIQREFPIAALGSVWQDLDGYSNAPYLYRLGPKRCLRLEWTGQGWHGHWRFAAVRKPA